MEGERGRIGRLPCMRNGGGGLPCLAAPSAGRGKESTRAGKKGKGLADWQDPRAVRGKGERGGVLKAEAGWALRGRRGTGPGEQSSRAGRAEGGRGAGRRVRVKAKRAAV